MMPLDVLYSFRRCPYAIRARLALLVSGVPFTIREVDLRRKPVDLLAASPKGTVPVFVPKKGAVINESLGIMRWALAQNDPEDWLAGEDVTLILTFDSRFKWHLDRYKYAVPESVEWIENRDACTLILHDLEERLTVTSNVDRDVRSFTDIAVIPFVRQFAAVDRAWFDAQPLPCVSRWLACHLASQLFLDVMAK